MSWKDGLKKICGLSREVIFRAGTTVRENITNVHSRPTENSCFKLRSWLMLTLLDNFIRMHRPPGGMWANHGAKGFWLDLRVLSTSFPSTQYKSCGFSKNTVEDANTTKVTINLAMQCKGQVLRTLNMSFFLLFRKIVNQMFHGQKLYIAQFLNTH